MLNFNKVFVREKMYEEHLTSKFPNKKLAIITCMDTRLVNLLPAALGIKNGDVKMIKNAGGMVLDPFDSTVRSVIVSVYELGVEHVMVIGHTDCGVEHKTVFLLYTICPLLSSPTQIHQHERDHRGDDSPQRKPPKEGGRPPHTPPTGAGQEHALVQNTICLGQHGRLRLPR